MPHQIENLVVLFWEPNINGSVMRVENLKSASEKMFSNKLRVDLEDSCWMYVDQGDPTRGNIYHIGSILKVRDILDWHPRRRVGPIAIFDRTKDDDLDDLTTLVETIIRRMLMR